MTLSTMYPAKANSPQTTLAAAITAADTTMTLSDASVLPAAPNLCTLGADEDAEVVSYSTITGNVVSGLIRGVSGTTASPWPIGTQVAREFTSYDHDTFKDNIEELNSVKVDEAPNDSSFYLRYQNGWAKSSNTYWSKAALRTILCTAFSTSKSYSIGDYVINGDYLYRFITAHPAGAWNADHVVQVQTMTEVQAKANTADLGTMAVVDDVPNDSVNYVRKNGTWYNIHNAYYSITDIRAMVASAFATNTSYSIGDYVIYNNLLYRFTTAHSAGAWNAEHVEQVQTMTEVEKKVLYFFEQSTSVTSTESSQFCSVSDSRIDENTVVLNCEFTVPSAIASNVSWTSTSGSISLKGICTSSNCKVNLVLGQKGN